MLVVTLALLTLAVHFKPDTGYTPLKVRYSAVASRYTVELSDTSVTMLFGYGRSLAMNFPRSVPAAHPTVRENANTDRVSYHNVFSGVDLVIYGINGDIEYDWIVAPGADAGAVQFSFEGANAVHVDRSGDLVVDTAAGQVRHTAPFIYQTGNHGREPV